MANPIELGKWPAFEMPGGSNRIELGGSFDFIPGTPPVVQNIIPAANTPLLAQQAVGFDFVSPSSTAFRFYGVLVRFASLGIYEVAFDGASFNPNYQGAVVAITNGQRFSGLLRIGGWPAIPTIVPIVIDVSGRENS